MATVNLDTAARLDVVHRRGDSFKLILDFGSTYPATSDSEPVGTAVYEFKVAASDRTNPFSISFKYIISDGEATKSKLTIEATDEAFDAIAPGLYVYDLQVTDVDQEVFEQVNGADYVRTLTYGTFKLVDDIGL